MTNIEINLRGNTSRRFPKQSYRVKIVDEQGNKRNLSIAGLRADDDWILNPMYSDTSKIREAISYWLWEQINSCGQAASSTRLAFSEVFMNGEYYGLYAIQERVDRKQVNGDKKLDILYKIIANDQPSAEELAQWDKKAEVCRGIELAFACQVLQCAWNLNVVFSAVVIANVCVGDDGKNESCFLLDGDDEWMEVLAANREFCGAGILADVLGDGEGECPICIACFAPVFIAADGCGILISLNLNGLCRCREGKGNGAVHNPVRREGCGFRCCQRCDDIILCLHLGHPQSSKEEKENMLFHSRYL